MQMSRRDFMAVSAMGIAGITGSCSADDMRKKRIVFIAGPASHGFGEHEHPAGCRLLANRLNAVNALSAEVYEKLPADDTALLNADAVIIFGDGASRNPLNGRQNTLEKLAESKTGIGIMHWALDPARELYKTVRDSIGGFFAQNWSINPMWTAEFSELPKHPITSGVNPFTIKDEWYYHMKFVPQLKNVTPVLSVLPPVSTLVRPDGPYSNNTHVRKAVLKNKQPQHLAWAYTRPNGGRGFGFSGGHFHWNWANDDFRKLLLNAAAWLAGANIPNIGIQSKTPDYKELITPLGKPPHNFEPEKVKNLLAKWKSD